MNVLASMKSINLGDTVENTDYVICYSSLSRIRYEGGSQRTFVWVWTADNGGLQRFIVEFSGYNCGIISVDESYL